MKYLHENLVDSRVSPLRLFEMSEDYPRMLQLWHLWSGLYTYTRCDR